MFKTRSQKRMKSKDAGRLRGLAAGGLAVLAAVLAMGSIQARAEVSHPSGYSVQVGCFTESQNAESCFDSLRVWVGREVLATLRIVDRPPFHVVRIGRFSEKSRSVVLLDRVRELFPEAILVSAEAQDASVHPRQSDPPLPREDLQWAGLELPVPGSAVHIPAESIPLDWSDFSPVDASVSGKLDRSAPSPAEDMKENAQADLDKSTLEGIVRAEAAREPEGAALQTGDRSGTRKSGLDEKPGHADPPRNSITMKVTPPRESGQAKARSGSSFLMPSDFNDWADPRAAVLLFLAAALCVMIAFRLWKRRPGPDPPVDMTEDETPEPEPYHPPNSLSLENQGQLFANRGQLSGVEGNILTEHQDIRTIFVTSSFKGEGKTTSAVQLAYAMTLGGSRQVLLVDFNGNSPKLHELFNVEAAPGFTDLNSADLELDRAIRATEYTNLTIMPYGSIRDAASTLSRKENFQAILDRIKDRFDMIIFDGPSVMGSSDAVATAGFFQGIVLIIEAEQTKWEVVQMVTEKLAKAGGSILGAVLNRRKYYIPKSLYGKI